MLAAAALLALSGALAVPAQAQTTCTTNTGDLWCGVVTVASVTGFVPGDGFSGSEGNLSETGFTYGTNSYTITRVFIAEGGVYDGELFFSLTSALTAADQAKLVLHVDGSSAEFAFSDAVDNVVSGTYIWLDAGLSWSVGDNVTLRLRGHPGDQQRPGVLPDDGDARGGGEQRGGHERRRGHSRSHGRGQRRHADLLHGGDGRGLVRLRRLDPADHDDRAWITTSRRRRTATR